MQAKDALLWALLQRKLFCKYRRSKRFYLLKQSMNRNSPFKCSKARIMLFPEKSEQLDTSKAMLQKAAGHFTANSTKPFVVIDTEQYLFCFSAHLLLSPFSIMLVCTGFFFDGIFLLHSTSGMFLIPWCLSMSVTHFPYMWSSAWFNLPWPAFSALLL